MLRWNKGEPYPSNWPEWLKKANLFWCRVEIQDGTVIWHDGTWISGTWESGIWVSGVWHSGTWKSGMWCSGIWADGVWESGTWDSGVWESGTWKSGFWCSGFWWGGTWLGGTWYDKAQKIWLGEVWKSDMRDSINSINLECQQHFTTGTTVAKAFKAGALFLTDSGDLLVSKEDLKAYWVAHLHFRHNQFDPTYKVISVGLYSGDVLIGTRPSWKVLKPGELEVTSLREHSDQ